MIRLEYALQYVQDYTDTTSVHYDYQVDTLLTHELILPVPGARAALLADRRAVPEHHVDDPRRGLLLATSRAAAAGRHGTEATGLGAARRHLTHTVIISVHPRACSDCPTIRPSPSPKVLVPNRHTMLG